MINQNELRVGNYWMHMNGSIHQIAAPIQIIDASIFGVGIPLTPEILEKCGFTGKYKSCGYHYQKGIINLSSQDEDDLGNEIENYTLHFHHDYKGTPIYFLHHLQNLYFALTGEELVYVP